MLWVIIVVHSQLLFCADKKAIRDGKFPEEKLPAISLLVDIPEDRVGDIVEIDSKIDPLASVTLANGVTARALLRAYCAATEVEDVQSKERACRGAMQSMEDSCDRATRDLFETEFKRARRAMLTQLAQQANALDQQRSSIVEYLSFATTPSGSSTEDKELVRGILYTQLLSPRKKAQGKHCPGCCGGCDIV